MPTNPSPWKRRLNTREAAEFLGVSAAAVRAWRLRGPDDPNAGPRFIRLSASCVVYDVDALEEFLDRKRMATQAAARSGRSQ
jgi:hypothetical protein